MPLSYTCDRKYEASTANAALACKLCVVNVPPHAPPQSHQLYPLPPLCVWLISIFKILNAAVKPHSWPCAFERIRSHQKGLGRRHSMRLGLSNHKMPTDSGMLYPLSIYILFLSHIHIQCHCNCQSILATGVGCSIAWCWNIFHTQKTGIPLQGWTGKGKLRLKSRWSA